MTERRPFAVAPFDRPLRIVVDDQTVQRDEALDLLEAFSGRPGVRVFHTAAEYPTRVEIGTIHTERDYIPVDYVEPDAVEGMAVFSASSWRRNAETTVAEHGGDIDAVFRELVLAQAAARHDVDVLVAAERALGTKMWKRFRDEAKLADARTACALLGLYLRAHNDFTVRVESSVSNFLDQERYYRGAALAALPQHEDWLHAAVTVWRERGRPEPLRLLRGIGMRLARALRARDYFNVRVRDLRPDDTWSEALFFFEALLLLVGGALDAAARFTHLAYGMCGSPTQAGWRRPRWRDALIGSESSFEPLLGPSGSLRAVADLVGILRNYIHEEALSQEIHRSEGGGPLIMDYQPGALAVEREHGARLLAAADALESPDAWGLQEMHDGVVLVLPAKYLRPLVRAVFEAIRQIMRTVDLDQLTTERTEPFDPAYFTPGVEYQRELLLLVGLTDS